MKPTFFSLISMLTLLGSTAQATMEAENTMTLVAPLIYNSGIMRAPILNLNEKDTLFIHTTGTIKFENVRIEKSTLFLLTHITQFHVRKNKNKDGYTSPLSVKIRTLTPDAGNACTIYFVNKNKETSLEHLSLTIEDKKVTLDIQPDASAEGVIEIHLPAIPLLYSTNIETFESDANPILFPPDIMNRMAKKALELALDEKNKTLSHELETLFNVALFSRKKTEMDSMD